MLTIILFHHVLGLTPGVIAFAGQLRAAGHTVHTPDLFDGQTFPSIPAGLAHVQSVGFGEVIARGRAYADSIPGEIVSMGMSLGVLPAQAVAQTRADVVGAVLLHGAIPVSEFSPHWPHSVPVQIHAMDADPEFVDSGDIDAARALVAEADDGALFLYPGSGHLFTDNGLADYDPGASALLITRVKDFLTQF